MKNKKNSGIKFIFHFFSFKEYIECEIKEQECYRNQIQLFVPVRSKLCVSVDSDCRGR